MSPDPGPVFCLQVERTKETPPQRVADLDRLEIRSPSPPSCCYNPVLKPVADPRSYAGRGSARRRSESTPGAVSLLVAAQAVRTAAHLVLRSGSAAVLAMVRSAAVSAAVVLAVWSWCVNLRLVRIDWARHLMGLALLVDPLGRR